MGMAMFPIKFYLLLHGVGQFTGACFAVSQRVTQNPLFSVLRYFLTNRFMVYMYNQGSTSFHSSNIPVRFKLFYEFSKRKL